MVGACDRRLFVSAVQPTCSLYGVTACFPAVRAHTISVIVCSRFLLTVVLDVCSLFEEAGGMPVLVSKSRALTGIFY